MNGRAPTSTYRLQLNAGTTFADARRLVPYLDALGVEALYVSPIARARPGSAHGYDVLDPTALNPELGTMADLEALSAELRGRGMGLVLDIVPNHMAATADNPWWADVLARGRGSRYAGYFDIDWERCGGKLVLPVLGRPLEEALAAGEIAIDGGCVRYAGRWFPLAPETPVGADVAGALDAQHYRLAFWRAGLRELNYRRFFDVSDLVGLRVEDAEVFDAVHALPLGLVARGIATGLRIDHVDGLLDPLGYLRRLREGAGPDCYLIVEKVLTGDEPLPAEWPVDGTTGYEFLNLVNGLYIDHQGLDALADAYAAATGVETSFADVVRESKRDVLQALFVGELERLAEELRAIAGADLGADLPLDGCRAVLTEVCAAFPVYRTYVRDFDVSPRDRVYIDAAIVEARRRGAPTAALDALERVLCVDAPASLSRERGEAWLTFVLRWQQFTGPATAKGLEDTALYRYHRLLSMNEVGAAPRGAVTPVKTFHRDNAARRPGSMLATATHDTKRGEDARARLNVLSELTDGWRERVERWRAMNASKRRDIRGAPAPDANDEWFLYQTLVGAWPLYEGGLPSFRARLRDYLTKVAREAKRHSSWLEPDEAYETALREFAEALLDDEAFLADLRPFAGEAAAYGMVNSLSQLVLRLTTPGVPDTYRGTELWDLSLVDPDNRRPVDFAARARMLEALDPARPDAVRALLDAWPDGRIKLHVLASLLRLRRERRALFLEGAYLPIEASGARAEHVVSFARRAGDAWAVTVAPRLVTRLAPAGAAPVGEMWGDTRLVLPPDAPAGWRDAIAGHAVEARDGRLALAEALAHAPAAALLAG